MGANERLGLEVVVSNPDEGKVLNQLLDTIKRIQEALKGLGVDNLNKAFVGLQKTTSNLKEGTDALEGMRRKAIETAQALLKAKPDMEWNEFRSKAKDAFNAITDNSKDSVKAMGAAYRGLRDQIKGDFDSIADIAKNVQIKLQSPTTPRTVSANAPSSQVAYADTSVGRFANPRSLTGDDDSMLSARQRHYDKLLSLEIKNKEAQEKVALQIQAAQESADTKLELQAQKHLQKLQEIQGQRYLKELLQAQKHLQKLQEIQGQRYLKELDKSGMYLNNGQENVKTSVVTAAYDENRARQEKSGEAIIASYKNSGIKIDPVQAESLNRSKQLAEILENISQKARVTKVTADEVNQAFARAGISIQEMDRATFRNTKSALNEVGLAIQGTTVEAKKATGAVGILGETFGGMASRLVEFYSMRMVIFGISSQFREAAAASIDFNQSIHDIIAISGETKSNIDAISKSIWDIAKTSRFSAKEVSESMQVMAQAGVSAKDLPVTTRIVDRFATSTASDPKLAADLFTTSMNVFGIKAENSIRISNALTAALNNSKLEASGLATAFNYLAPMAQQVGYSMEHALGIIATMSQSGVKPSTIGTGVSQMIKEFSAPKPKLMNMLEYYGLSQDDVNPLKHSFDEIIDKLGKASGKTGEVGVQVNHLFQALESRVGRSAIAAIQLGGEAFRNMESSITGTSAALIAYDKSMEGARSRMNIVKQSFHEIVSELGEKLAPVLIAGTEVLRGFLNFLGNDTIQKIALVTSALGALALSVAAVSAAAKTAFAVSMGESLMGMLGIAGIATTGPIAIGVLAALAVGIGVVSYASRTGARDLEAQEKALLKNVEGTQKYGEVLNKLTNNTAAGTLEYKKYQELRDKHKDKDGETIALGERRIKMTDETRQAIAKLMSDYPDIFKKLGTEINYYKDLYKAIEAVNNAKAGTATKAKTDWNKGITSVAMEEQRNINQAKADLANAKASSNTGYRAGDESLIAKAPAVIRAQNEYNAAIARGNNAINSFVKAHENLRDLGVTAPGVGTPAKGEVLSTKSILRTTGDLTFNTLETAHDKVIPDKDTTPPLPGKKSGRSNVSTARQEVNFEKAEMEALKTEIEDLKVKSKDLPASTDDINKNEQLALSKLKQLNAIEKEKAYSEIEAQYKTYDKKAGAYVFKEDYDPTEAQATIDALKQAADNKLSVNTTTLQRYFSDLLLKKNELLDKFNDESLKYENEAIEKNAELYKKTYEDNLKGRIDTEDQLMSIYMAERKHIQEKYDAERKQNANDINKQLRDDLNRNPNYTSQEIGDRTTKAQGTIEVKNKVTDVSEQKSVMDALLKLSNAGKENVDKIEKAQDKILASKKAELDLEKQFVWTSEEKERISIESEQATLTVQKNKNKAYQEWIDKQSIIRNVGVTAINTDPKYANNPTLKTEALKLFDEDHQKQLQDYNDKLEAGKLTVEQYQKILIELEDQSFFGNLSQGLRDALSQMATFKSATIDLGKSLGTLTVDGLKSSIAGAIGTVTNPDTSSISSLKTTISDLKDQKKTLQDDINNLENNSSKTTQELADLKAKKKELKNVTDEINKQTDALNAQNSVWGALEKGVKGILDAMIKKLDEYIAELVLAAVKEQSLNAFKSASSWFSSLFSSTTTTTTTKAEGGVIVKQAEGGIVRGYANGGTVLNGLGGGAVPLSEGTAGVDSVHALLMPGEVVIKKSSVDYYGADRLLALNDKKIQKIASGGMVGTTTSKVNTTGKDTMTLQIVNVADTSSIPAQPVDTQQVINIVSFDAKRKGTTYKTIKAVMSG